MKTWLVTSLVGATALTLAHVRAEAPATSPLAATPAWGGVGQAVHGTAATGNARPSVDLDGVVEGYCVRCHNERRTSGNLSLVGLQVDQVADSRASLVTGERMIRKLRAGMMPPPGARRPPADSLRALAEALESVIDDAAEDQPRAGSRTFQRINRAEYAAVVHDLLGITVDAGEWLPSDPISEGFDNIADAQTLSPTLMDAYLNAASEVARRALGQADAPVTARTIQTPPRRSQHAWDRVEGAPFGTRGGISALHTFPADGEYRFSMSFMSGWGERYHDIDLSIDGEQIALVRYGGDIDFQGRKSFPVETDPIFIRAGEHRVTAAFVRTMDGPYEDLIRPNDWSLTGTEASYGTTSLPHLTSLTIEGPHNPVGVSDTEARRRVFICRPTVADEEEPCAREILRPLVQGAYGRTPTDDDVDDLMRFYRLGAQEEGFETGVRTALEALLTSPHFLFRMERQPERVDPGEVYRLSDQDLARRLSLFLWGALPDAELQQMADEGDLHEDDELERQTRRMLADPRSEALATRFASLWLRLQDLERVEPDAFWFPDFSEQLRHSMRRETELFFHDLVQRDRSLLDLYRADWTFLDERLADHYGVPDVRGDHFRRVAVADPDRRGILGHGSVLVQTSLGNRTSPVLRGKWVMEVLLGTPPPPPPPGVPDLEETEHAEPGKVLTTSERMAMHRANPSCSSCHEVIDPIGLALDNFDVTGAWRIREGGQPLDTRGTFYDGTEIERPSDLVDALLQRPIPLVRTFTENLMAYALGRRIEPEDQSTVRQITREAARTDYAMTDLILGVVLSDPFRMKEAAAVSTEDASDENASTTRSRR